MILRLACMLSLVLPIQSRIGAADLYVSPSGQPGWSGMFAEPSADKSDGPLPSIASALEQRRKLRSSSPQASKEWNRIIVREGTYYLSDTIQLLPEDSGTISDPLTITAFSGEQPVISGGIPITSWNTLDSGICTARMSGNYFYQLFSNRGRAQRARSPNDDFYHVSGRVAEDKTDAINNKSFRYDREDIKAWNDPDVDVVIIHSWETSRMPIAKVNTGEKIVEFSGSAYWPFTSWDERQRYYVENSAESLDQPGEWRLDREAETLHYIPPRGESPESQNFIAPQLEQLLVIRGNVAENKYVENVRIEGLSFRHADWVRPAEGISNPQAAVSISGAVEMHGARHIEFVNCEIAHVGGYAMRVKTGSKDIQVEHNHFHDLGAGGIGIGDTELAKSPLESTGGIRCINNYIHDGGHVFESGVGVWTGQSSDNTIAHNEISDFGYTGVSVGWTWGYGDSGSQRNVIEYNHIHHIGSGILSDMGGIYTLGFSAGSILRNNHIHHVTSHHYGGWGIYPDEGTSHLLIENNIVHHTKTGGFHQHYGKENMVQNNIFAYSQEGQIIRSREEDHRSFRFERNIVWFDEGHLLGSNWSDGHFFMDYNLYGSADGPLDFKGMTFDEWRYEKQMDLHSLIGDPRFLDSTADDYRLAPDSPALALGFRPIDMSEIGLSGSAEWRALPSRFTSHRQKWPDPPKPITLDEDFESYAPGQTIPYGISYGLSDGALIEVSNQKAAAGNHSLKFIDAPGLDLVFNPHYYLDPGWSSGSLVGSFDLMLEPGASFYHEWRTDGSSYHAGPSIRIDGEGQCAIGSEPPVKLPHNEWVHVEVRATLGREADAAYSIWLALPDGSRKEFKDIPCDPDFRSLRWIGFCSMADGAKSFWIDNFKLAPVEP